MLALFIISFVTAYSMSQIIDNKFYTLSKIRIYKGIVIVGGFFLSKMSDLSISIAQVVQDSIQMVIIRFTRNL